MWWGATIQPVFFIFFRGHFLPGEFWYRSPKWWTKRGYFFSYASGYKKTICFRPSPKINRFFIDLLLMVQKSHSQPPGMLLKPVVNNGRYLPYQLVIARFLISTVVASVFLGSTNACIRGWRLSQGETLRFVDLPCLRDFSFLSSFSCWTTQNWPIRSQIFRKSIISQAHHFELIWFMSRWVISTCMKRPIFSL